MQDAYIEIETIRAKVMYRRNPIALLALRKEMKPHRFSISCFAELLYFFKLSMSGLVRFHVLSFGTLS